MSEKIAAQEIHLIIDNATEAPPMPDKPGGDGAPPDERTIEYSDDALALEFSNKFVGDLLFVAGRWMVWDGSRWVADDVKGIWNLSRKVCRRVAQRCENNKRLGGQISSKATVVSVAALASSDPRHVARVAEFDARPWAINTPSGILDLHSGSLSPHDRNARMSKITAAKLGGEAPMWRKFLQEVTGGDGELEKYLQRCAGYALTGSIEEHAVFFAYGSGGNGKSVFLNVLVDIMGDYALSAPMDIFCVSKGERHPTELAMLAGARLVIASETEEGRRWDEAKLKAITGGDQITARHMRQDFFSFRPAFKLFVAGNFRPAIRSIDRAMRRRLHMIPFIQEFAKPDKRLQERLRQEWGGILGWALEGCLEWQRIGLDPPVAVVNATEDYFEGEDALGRWVKERCTQEAGATALTKALYRDWKSWATDAGEYIMSEKRFVQGLQRRGFDRWQNPVSRARGFCGVGLKETQQSFELGDGGCSDSHDELPF